MILKFLTLTILAAAYAAASAQAQDRTGNVLIVYFSKTNNTQSVAEQIRARTGGDIFRITTKNAYPTDYRATTSQARTELDNNERPELTSTVPPEEMKKYDTIFVGYPNWWGTAPMAVFTFLEQYDLAGKTILPFCTHEGSGLGRSSADIEKSCSGATIGQGLAVRGGSAASAGNDVANWLRRLGLSAQ